MKKLMIIVALLTLSGCTWPVKPDQSTVVKYKYIVNTIPEEMLTVPSPTYKIDSVSATDKDASKWMIDSEKRYQEIEKKLKAIKTYQDDKLKNLKVPPEDLIKN